MEVTLAEMIDLLVKSQRDNSIIKERHALEGFLSTLEVSIDLPDNLQTLIIH